MLPSSDPNITMFSLLEILGTAFALSIDAMVVTLCWSTTQKHITFADTLKFSVAFGLFQGLMPAIGWGAGAAFASFVSQWDHWLAFALLAFVAGSMIKEGLSDEDEGDIKTDEHGTVAWGTLLMLAVATSLDALAVGFSFALSDYPIVEPALIIAAVCFLLTALCMPIGQSISARAASHTNKLSFVGAAVLLAIGLNILREHNVF